MKQSNPGRILSLAALAALVVPACSGGSSTPTGPVSPINPGGKFVVLKTEPLNNGRLYLNDPIRIDFSTPVELSSADLNTVSFQVLDQNGSPVQEQPTGTFRLDTSPGDSAPGRRLLFIPRFPTNDTYDNGGFRPGRTYLVQLVAGDQHNGTVLRDVNGRGLTAPVTFQFSTADGTTPAQLFSDRVPGGPRRVGFEISPTPDAQGVALNKFGSPPVELRLVFDQPLNPHSANVPVLFDTNPLLRTINQRGRIFLEYTEHPTPTTETQVWIPADVELEVNDLARSVVLLRPVGVLPNNAEVRVIVENTLEDIAGESNVANPAFNRVFATFRTRAAYEPQFDAVVEEFQTNDMIDFNAPFVEPQAQFQAGNLRHGFGFEGTSTTLEFEPQTPEVVLNTDFTQVVPKIGPAFNVSGGVFNFANVKIPAGVTVNGIGRNPMVWLVSGDFVVEGLLSVRGGDGQRVDTLNSANYPSAGGQGVCGGGNGGAGSPSGTSRDMTGQAGFGAGQRTGGGGRPGRIGCVAACGRGSGGGGGSMATQGDPNYKGSGTSTLPTSFQQKVGIGGQGCTGSSGATSRSLAGGEAGPLVFSDSSNGNNFYGAGIDLNVNRPLRIVGELAVPLGGEGGGGGGDLSNAGGCNPLEPNWINDNKGGGGGGGGGVLIVKALGDIVVSLSGRITADGGHGGGGEQAGSCNQGGGGGGGSGGMVILQAGGKIILHAKGTGSTYTYAADNYQFCISADGGVCKTGSFGSPIVTGKYPTSGAIPSTYGTTYDAAPLGAFGGMGVVQLMAAPGNNQDNTNTVLDDNIEVWTGTTLASGTTKTQLLAWRGYPDATGTRKDDFGQNITVTFDGDIRPAPVLLPVPFNTKSRARSKWIDTGASKRRPLTAPDGEPRGIVEDTLNGFLAGPTYEFAGTIQAANDTQGYAGFTSVGDSVRASYPAMLAGAGADVLSLDASAAFQDQPAYLVTLTTAALGNTDDRYCGYQAELLNAQGTLLGGFRILAHTATQLWLSTEGDLLPASAAKLQVRAKFYEIAVNGAEGFGRTFRGSTVIPQSNVRIGFAFSSDPTVTANRYPADPKQFLFNLGDPAVQETIRSRHMSFVQWDVVFDTDYPNTAGETSVRSLDLTSPRQELRFLRIPFRF